MELNENISEYYDELYPVTLEQKKFYEKESSIYSKPVKYLRVGCGTGTFEHSLARDGADATGLETGTELLESANRKRRTQLMSLRYFQMSSLEMARFLGHGFYNIVSSLDNRILFIRDKILVEKFFYDAKQLLTADGKLILELVNFKKIKDSDVVKFPTRESIRVKLYTQLVSKDDGNGNRKKIIQQDLETGNGKIIPVTRDAEIYPLVKEEIEEFAKKVGFKKFEFYADFNRTPFKDDSEKLLAVIS
ncbi:class I SAM-dependent methyltransferase [Treponema zioleckii]|uniref:class I SAM-dependent methyltransferase n=1 Tax=Treponema zioleckii TaxID=331680 RepID=UPI00168C0EF9|nr:methyltransferase domain-containing protein [Treponema zioleckii]